MKNVILQLRAEFMSKPIIMLNMHVQNKMLSFCQMEETVLFTDLVSLQNSSLKDHSEHYVLDQCALFIW